MFEAEHEVQMKLARLGPVGFGFVRAPRNTSRSHCALSVRFERARNISICVGRFGLRGIPAESSPRIVNRSLRIVLDECKARGFGVAVVRRQCGKSCALKLSQYVVV